jgi:hypothetical protein
MAVAMADLEPRPELSSRQVRRLEARARKRKSRAEHWHRRAELWSDRLDAATSDRAAARYSASFLNVQMLYEKEAERFNDVMDELYGPGWEDRLDPA